MLKSFWKRDHLGFGVLLGLVVPMMAFWLVVAFDKAIVSWKNIPFLLTDDLKMVLAISFNFIFFRRFMVVLHRDRTGRGILLSTFLYAIIYLILFHVAGLKQLI